MSEDSTDPRAAAARVEALVAELAGSGDARVRAAAEDLIRQLMHLYGAGLSRVLDIAYEQDETAANALFERLAEDPLVGSLLALHGLHPHELDRRVARALERVRPVVDAAGATLTLVAADAHTVRLRLGTAEGVLATGANVRPLVERILAEAAPEIQRIEFEGAAAPAQLIQITR